MLAQYTMEELMVEYLEDSIEMDPAEAFPTQTLESGVQFARTGDETVDAWEKAIAEGKAPDFSKAFKHDEDRKIFEAWLKPKKDVPASVVAPALDAAGEELPDWVKEAMDGDGFADDYKKE